MAAVDVALAPLDRMIRSPGPMNTSELATVKSAFRHAISVLVYGPPEEPVSEDEVVAQDAAADDPNAPDAGGTTAADLFS